MAWGIRVSRQTDVALEVLVNPVNANVTSSVVIDAATVALNSDGDRVLPAGSPLSKNVSNQYELFTNAGGQVCRGILAHEVRLPDATAKSDLPAAMWSHGQWFRADRMVGWATPAIQAAIRAALPTCKFS